MRAALLMSQPVRAGEVADYVDDVSDYEESMAVVMLNDRGLIRDCNRACETLFGCPASRLLWRHVSVLLPQLAGIELMQCGCINPRLRFLSHIGYLFEVVGLGGVHIACKLFLNDVENAGRHYLRLIIRPVMGEMPRYQH